MSKRQKIFLLLLFLFSISIPYLLAWILSGENKVFTGFLLNPMDGNSYLAKMIQGYQGKWKFTLPYTTEAGEGGFLFLFYIFLGHLARWMHLPNIVVFHGSRLLSACFLSYAIFSFVDNVYKPGYKVANLITGLLLFGSGMGWLVVFGGILPTDFWVAEAYPFLSAFSNPHFPLGLGILLQTFTFYLMPGKTWHYGLFMVLGLLEALILPFGLVVVGIVLLLYCLLNWMDTNHELSRINSIRTLISSFAPLISTLLLGGPFLLYQFWISTSDPVLAGWNAQNLTPSPALWDLLISFSPAVILAFYACWLVIRKLRHELSARLLLVWFIAGMILIYIPTTIQRRFMLGLYIPTILLAGVVLEQFLRKPGLGWIRPVFFVFSVTTNLILLLGAFVGIITHSDQIYMDRYEFSAFTWIQANAPLNAVVVSSPEIGSMIPAVTGRRVIYGHPFETVNASQQEQEILEFYAGRMDREKMTAWLLEKKANYVFWGDRERRISDDPSGWQRLMDRYQVVYQYGNVMIYTVRR